MMNGLPAIFEALDDIISDARPVETVPFNSAKFRRKTFRRSYFSNATS